jgi:uncharacterized protein
LSLKSGLKILKDINCPTNIIEHSKAVYKKAKDMASAFRYENGFDVDLELIETGAILHDIGRSTTHTIHHGVAGAEILKNLNYPLAVVNITARHIGAGIPQDEAEILGLPPGEYMPVTLEEKIVAHADNLINGTVEVDLDFVIRKWEKKMGKDHPSIKRLKKLDKDVFYPQ